MRRCTVDFIVPLALFAITFACFSPVLNAEFVGWDDDLLIFNNPRLSTPWPQRIRWAFTDFESAMRFIPLTLLGLSINYDVGGLRPWGYHLGNLLLHCGSVVLLFVILRRLLALGIRKDDSTSAIAVLLGAVFGALLWGLHPLRVEPVAWCTTRSYCQATFFALAAMLCYLKAFDAPGSHKPRWPWYWGAVLAYAASLLSHPVGLGLVGALMVVDAHPLGRASYRWGWWRDRQTLRSLVEKLPLIVVAGAVLLLALMARLQSSAVFPRAVSLAEFGVIERLLQALYLCAYYAWRPWYPIGLSPMYTTLMKVSAQDWLFVLNAMIVIVISAIVIVMRRRWPWAIALWISHLVILVPVLGWTEHPHYPADRYSLLVGTTWSAAVAGVFSQAWRHHVWRGPIAIAATAALVLLSTLTIRQTAVWQNTITLCEHVLANVNEGPFRSDLYRRIGLVYDASGEWAKAQEAFSQALRSNPNDRLAHAQYAWRLLQHGQKNEAIEHWRQALAVQPADEDTRINLGIALIETGKYSEAASQLNAGLDFHPHSLEMRYNLAVALARQGRLVEAIDQFDRLLRQVPDHTRAKEARQILQQMLDVNTPSSDRSMSPHGLHEAPATLLVSRLGRS